MVGSLSTGVTLADSVAAIATVLLLQEATRFLVKRTPKATLTDGGLMSQVFRGGRSGSFAHRRARA